MIRSSNKFTPFIILGLILLVAAILRLYKLDEYGYFADQARDLLEVRNWLTLGKIPLQGPLTSMGTFHLGPLYYYLITPFVIIARFDPIGAVYFEVFDGLLLVALGFLLFYKFVDLSTAFIFALLVTLSPLAISLSKGSWNPHPQLLVTLLLVFSFMQFVKTGFLKYIFISAVLIGLGVQLHYTFLTNAFSLLVMIFLFKREMVLNYKMWLLFIFGFLLPLIPFLVGQFLNGFADINQAWLYINQSESQHKILVFKSILDRLSFPFTIFFPFDNLSWFLRLVAPFFYLFILGNVIIIAFLKNHLNLLTKIVLVLFFLTLFQTTFMQIPFYNHYNYTAAVLALFLVTIYISYLCHYAKLKFIWLPVLAIFIWWEIFLIPHSYEVTRTPKVVSDISKAILADRKLYPKDPMVGIFILSPVTLSPGLEYRYLLEKEGVKTFSSSRAATADYVVMESSVGDKMNFKLEESDHRIVSVKEFQFGDGGTVIKYAKLYKLEKMD